MDRRPIRLIELFAGVGSQAMALRNLGLEYETVAISEFCPHADKAYRQIHGEVNNLGDITQIESLPECDLLTYSFPCQDLSISGLRKGMCRTSNTRSSLLWEVERLLREYKESGRHLPETLLMENVKGLLFKDNIRAFHEWISILSELGYTSSYTVMNAKNFDVPQSRERVFMVSRLNDEYFIFPPGTPTELRIKDILEENADSSLYVNDELVETAE